MKKTVASASRSLPSINTLLYLGGLALLLFIPLYPKIPLFDVLPGYIVRARLEDVLVILLGLGWVVQAVRGKVSVTTPAILLVGAYGLVGLGSLLFATLLQQTIPTQLLHVGKSGLHLFRYLEYFIIFIVLHSTHRRANTLKTVVAILAITVVVVGAYGFGQRHWGWPLFSTMNREFSKGVALQLSEFARVQSTFAGHYDLAAYLVIVLPLLFAATLSVSNKLIKIILVGVHLLGLWLMAVGALKSSFIAYGVGMAVVTYLHVQHVELVSKKRWKQLLQFTMVGLLAMVVSITMLVAFAPSALMQLADIAYTQPQAAKVLHILGYTPTQSLENKPSDVYVDVPDYVEVATISAAGKESIIIDERARVYSDNAIKYGLSMGIRLDTLWPNAIKGFVRNPLLGKGYATLTKEKVEQFTEAESTDNNYLRILGETGTLGLLSFFGIVAYTLLIAKRQTRIGSTFQRYFMYGFIGGTTGLLINALYIDVFAASKVAFTFWSLAGIVVGNSYTSENSRLSLDIPYKKALLQVLRNHWPVLLVGGVAIVVLYRHPFYEFGQVRSLAFSNLDFKEVVAAWCSHQPNTSCQSTASLNPYAMLISSSLHIYEDIGMYVYVNMLLFLTTTLASYKALRRVFFSKEIQTIALSLLLTTYLSTQIPYQPSSFNLWVAVAATIFAFVLSTHPALKFVLKTKKALMLHITLPKTPQWINSLVFSLIFSFLLLSPPLEMVFSSAVTAYNQSTNYWQYTVVRRANKLFSFPSEFTSDTQAMLVTTIPDSYRLLWGSNDYRLLPTHSAQQESAAILQPYLDELSNGKRVFLTDYGLDGQVGQHVFDEYSAHFDLNTIELDCQYSCNFYELEERVETLLPEPAEALLGATINSSTQNQNSTITILHNRFDPNHPELQNTTKTFSELASDYIKTDAQTLSIITGDILHAQETTQLAFFKQMLLNTTDVSMLYIPGNQDQQATKLIESPFTEIRMGSTYLIAFPPNDIGGLKLADQKRLMTTVLRLSSRPEIKNIVILSHQPGWFYNAPYIQDTSALLHGELTENDSFFNSQILPRLSKLNDKQIYLVAGNLSNQAFSPEYSAYSFQDPQFAHITYVGSSLNQYENDVALQLELEGDEVSFVGIDRTGKNIDLSTQNLEWLYQHFPDSRPSAMQKSSNKIALSLLTLSLTGAIYALHFGAKTLQSRGYFDALITS